MIPESAILDDSQLRRLLCDYIVVDKNLLVVEAGEGIASFFKIIPNENGLNTFFISKSPEVALSFDCLKSFSAKTIFFEAIMEPVLQFTIRVEYLKSKNQLLLFFCNFLTEHKINSVAPNEQFLYAITHELKNPLAAIQSAVELIELKQERFSKELSSASKNYFRMVYDEMGRIVLALRNLAMISGKKEFVLKREAVSLTGLVEGIVADSFPEYAIGQNIHLLVKGKPQQVSIDRRLFSQGITTLVSAAIQHTAADVQIEILIQFTKEETAITIKDSFSEMPERLRAAIPEILKSDVVEKLSEKDEWGIWAVKKIMTAHNGAFVFLSKPKGKIEFKVSI